MASTNDVFNRVRYYDLLQRREVAIRERESLQREAARLKQSIEREEAAILSLTTSIEQELSYAIVRLAKAATANDEPPPHADTDAPPDVDLEVEPPPDLNQIATAPLFEVRSERRTF